jgi:hypothetical protein
MNADNSPESDIEEYALSKSPSRCWLKVEQWKLRRGRDGSGLGPNEGLQQIR